MALECNYQRSPLGTAIANCYTKITQVVYDNMGNTVTLFFSIFASAAAASSGASPIYSQKLTFSVSDLSPTDILSVLYAKMQTINLQETNSAIDFTKAVSVAD